MKPAIESKEGNFEGDTSGSTGPNLAEKTAKSPLGTLTVTAIAMWFLFMLVASFSGIFDRGHRPPVALGTAAVLPVLVFAAGYLNWAAFRRFVLGANLPLLTLAQTWRVGGVVFVILYYKGILPGTFALPAGWGDFAIGATAPLLAWAISSRKRFPKRVFVLWNVLGLLDLVMAVSLGVLSSATPVGVLAGSITTEAMGRFPLSMIPTFFVPLLATFHLVALNQVKQQTVARELNTGK